MEMKLCLGETEVGDMLTICLTFSTIWVSSHLRLKNIQQKFTYYTNIGVGITVDAAFSA